MKARIVLMLLMAVSINYVHADSKHNRTKIEDKIENLEDRIKRLEDKISHLIECLKNGGCGNNNSGMYQKCTNGQGGALCGNGGSVGRATCGQACSNGSRSKSE